MADRRQRIHELVLARIIQHDQALMRSAVTLDALIDQELADSPLALSAAAPSTAEAS